MCTCSTCTLDEHSVASACNFVNIDSLAVSYKENTRRSKRDKEKKKDHTTVKHTHTQVQSRRTVKQLRRFDSTLGYPGEGPGDGYYACAHVNTCHWDSHYHRKDISGANRRHVKKSREQQKEGEKGKKREMVKCPYGISCSLPHHFHHRDHAEESMRTPPSGEDKSDNPIDDYESWGDQGHYQGCASPSCECLGIYTPLTWKHGHRCVDCSCNVVMSNSSGSWRCKTCHDRQYGNCLVTNIKVPVNTPNTPSAPVFGAANPALNSSFFRANDSEPVVYPSTVNTSPTPSASPLAPTPNTMNGMPVQQLAPAVVPQVVAQVAPIPVAQPVGPPVNPPVAPVPVIPVNGGGAPAPPVGPVPPVLGQATRVETLRSRVATPFTWRHCVPYALFGIAAVGVAGSAAYFIASRATPSLLTCLTKFAYGGRPKVITTTIPRSVTVYSVTQDPEPVLTVRTAEVTYPSNGFNTLDGVDVPPTRAPVVQYELERYTPTTLQSIAGALVARPRAVYYCILSTTFILTRLFASKRTEHRLIHQEAKSVDRLRPTKETYIHIGPFSLFGVGPTIRIPAPRVPTLFGAEGFTSESNVEIYVDLYEYLQRSEHRLLARKIVDEKGQVMATFHPAVLAVASLVTDQLPRKDVVLNTVDFYVQEMIAMSARSQSHQIGEVRPVFRRMGQ